MNRVVLIGRLTRDPDIRYTQGENPQAIARYSIAVDRPGKHKEGDPTADFINCVAFGKRAEFADKYLHKGIKIALTGHIRTGSYTNRDGQKVYTTDVIVDSCEFCESKQSEAPKEKPKEEEPKGDEFMQIPDGLEDELPFK